MLKKTITFSDLDGNKITEDFYFHLSKAKVAELELIKGEGGMTGYLTKIVETKDGQGIMDAFRELLRAGYGKRSENGRRFIQDEETWLDFAESDAFSELFIELISDTEGGRLVDFIRGMLPADLQEQAKEIDLEEIKKSLEPQTVSGEVVQTQAQPKANSKNEPAWIREKRNPTQTELSTMTEMQLRVAYARKPEELTGNAS